MAKLSTIKVEIGIPSIGKIEGTWEPDRLEEQAAWALYIELITRISIIEIEYETGLLRESLSSLYSLFPTSRTILRESGPAIARPKGKGSLSLGYITINILNLVLRPFLSKWHPLLLDYEQTKPKNSSVLEHERKWEHYDELRQSLGKTQQALLEYAGVLAEVAKIPSLVIQHQKRLGG